MNCDICNKWIKYPKNWNRHINSKVHIRKTIIDAKMERPHGNGENVPECPQMSPIVPKKRIRKYVNCEYCGIKKRNDHLNIHLTTCIKKQEQDILKAENDV